MTDGEKMIQVMDLKKYYGSIKTSKSLLSLARMGSVDRLYMPLSYHLWSLPPTP